ncbi:hypothetical protein AQJ23_45135 [Streptomyces antibioticus]|nr:hypothetical protein [Streptomyces antibioticus]KUN16464.1 hypothetical protein AQJ23_45135 [Streptomyces antibioticus]
MTEHRITCNQDSSDYVTADRQGGEVRLRGYCSGEFEVSVYASSEDARTFARDILALADRIDGGEVAKAVETSTRTPQVGDKVRVVKDSSTFRSGQYVGLVGTLESVRPDDILPNLVYFGDGSAAHGDKDNGRWYCAEVALVDEPAPEPLADWERDLLEASEPAPARSSRARFVEEAKELLSGMPSSVDDVIQLAEWLAAGE